MYVMCRTGVGEIRADVGYMLGRFTGCVGQV